jgi:predicted esterase
MHLYQKTKIITELPMSYLNLEKGADKPLLLFVHGFTDTAHGFLRRAYPEEAIDSRFEILAPNGIFPVPQKIDKGWREAYAWYFSESRDSAIVPPSVGAEAVDKLLLQLNLQEREKIIVGFSQGGFLIPHLLQKLKHVKKAIGIGCLYRVEDYPDSLSTVIDGIHGTADAVVAFDRGRDSFAALKAKNPLGQFHAIESLGHTMSDESRALLKRLISESIS